MVAVKTKMEKKRVVKPRQYPLLEVNRAVASRTEVVVVSHRTGWTIRRFALHDEWVDNWTTCLRWLRSHGFMRTEIPPVWDKNITCAVYTHKSDKRLVGGIQPE